MLGKVEKLSSELRRLHPQETGWVKGRMDQIKNYWRLEQFKHGAAVMLDVAQAFQLSGDLSVLEMLCDAVSDIVFN